MQYIFIVLIISIAFLGYCKNSEPKVPRPPRVMQFSEGQMVTTIVGGNIAQVVEADTYSCFGGGCPVGNAKPKIYLVRLPNGTLESFKEYELKAK